MFGYGHDEWKSEAEQQPKSQTKLSLKPSQSLSSSRQASYAELPTMPRPHFELS